MQTTPAIFQNKTLTALLGLLLGALSVLAFAPFGVWIVLPVTLAVFFLLLFYTQSSGAAFRLGYFFGVGLFGAGVYWVYYSLHLFGEAIAPLAGLGALLFALLLAMFPAFFALISFRFVKSPMWFLLTAPALWVLFEWIRSWFLTGFPWLSAGYSTLMTPFAGYAPVGGVFLNSLVVALCSGLLACCLHYRRVSWFALAVLGVVALGGGGYFLKMIEWTRAIDDREVSVTMVQGNISQELKFQANLLDDSIDLYSSLSETGAELVIWPESAIPTVYSDVSSWENEFAQYMEEKGTTVISGGFTSNEDYTKYYNAIKVLDGTEDQMYVKRHLVPFGEFIPFREILTLLADYINIPMSNLSPGTGPINPLTVNGVHYAMSICYEDAFGSEMRGQFPKANVLINVSNDGWFGDSTAPHQHQEIAAMRSLEFGRPMLRVTNTGISSLIDHRGRVVSEGPQFEAVAIDVTVTPREGVTPFVRLGDWLALALVALLLVVGWLTGLLSARKATAPLPDSHIKS